MFPSHCLQVTAEQREPKKRGRARTDGCSLDERAPVLWSNLFHCRYVSPVILRGPTEVPAALPPDHSKAPPTRPPIASHGLTLILTDSAGFHGSSQADNFLFAFFYLPITCS